MRFWLDRGVDGFRVDVIWHLIKDDQFRDNPPNPDYQPRPSARTIRSCPSIPPIARRSHDIVAEMRKVIDDFDDRVLIGEIYLPLERLVAYYGADLARRASAVQFPALSRALARARRWPR